MKVQIDNKTMLRVTSEYFAPMKRTRDKREKSGYAWVEYMWFSKLESCIRYLTQKRVAEKNVTVQLNEFLTEFKKNSDEIRSILEANNVV